MRLVTLRALVFLSLLSIPAVAVERVEPLILPESIVAPAVPRPPLRLGESMEPLASLRRATEGAVDQLEALKARNASLRLPVQIGFARPLREPLRLRTSDLSATSPAGGQVWGTRVRVDGAYRLRLHLMDVKLPPDTRLWVWGQSEVPRAFGLELSGPDGDLWTPSVGGEEAFLEIELPSAPSTGERVGLEVSEVGEIFRLGAGGAPVIGPPIFDAVGECLLDATCFNASTFDKIADVRKGIAHLQFEDSGDLFICSGGLLNDSESTGTPYLLTANHCFSTQAEASTLEAFWDYKSSSCGGSFPNLGSLPRSQGATLLASSANSDFTFVRLNSIPGGRALLGWSTQALANGTVLHRISHPAPDGFPFSQQYSQSTVKTTGGACGGIPRPRFLYSSATLGGTFGGSSGSPVFIQGGIVVGQLFGACGLNAEDGCDDSNSEVDGAFATTFPSISQFLNAAPTTLCNPDATTLCIDNQPGDRRFRVRVTFQSSGNGKAIPLTSLGVNSGGLFWFFNATNPELLVKVLNGCGVNNKYWVFWAAGTDVAMTLTVTDTVTGQSKSYSNPQGTAAKPVQDTNALPCS